MARLKLKQKNEDGTETPLDAEGAPLVVEVETSPGVRHFPGDLLADMEDMPTCKECGKRFAEPREGDVCCVCLKKQQQTTVECNVTLSGRKSGSLMAVDSVSDPAPAEPPVPKDVFDACVAACGPMVPVDDLLAPILAAPSVPAEEPTESAPEVTTSDEVLFGSCAAPGTKYALLAPAAPTGRPSLDVAIETHRNLAVRVEALCGRIMGWSFSYPLSECTLSDARGCARSIREIFSDLGVALQKLKDAGFVAKTTPKSRIEARLVTAKPVKLREDAKKLWSRYYSPEELEQVEVVGRDDEAGVLFVKLGKREGALPITVKLSQLVAG